MLLHDHVRKGKHQIPTVRYHIKVGVLRLPCLLCLRKICPYNLLNSCSFFEMQQWQFATHCNEWTWTNYCNSSTSTRWTSNYALPHFKRYCSYNCLHAVSLEPFENTHEANPNQAQLKPMRACKNLERTPKQQSFQAHLRTYDQYRFLQALIGLDCFGGAFPGFWVWIDFGFSGGLLQVLTSR